MSTSSATAAVTTRPARKRKALPIAQVEQRIADPYGSIELNPGQRERIEQIVLATLRRQQAVNDERLAEISEETQTIEANQTKLLDAYSPTPSPTICSSPTNGASRPSWRTSAARRRSWSPTAPTSNNLSETPST